jgi:hypothetical protein
LFDECFFSEINSKSWLNVHFDFLDGFVNQFSGFNLLAVDWHGWWIIQPTPQ